MARAKPTRHVMVVRAPKAQPKDDGVEILVDVTQRGNPTEAAAFLRDSYTQGLYDGGAPHEQVTTEDAPSGFTVTLPSHKPPKKYRVKVATTTATPPKDAHLLTSVPLVDGKLDLDTPEKLAVHLVHYTRVNEVRRQQMAVLAKGGKPYPAECLPAKGNATFLLCIWDRTFKVTVAEEA